MEIQYEDATICMQCCTESTPHPPFPHRKQLSHTPLQQIATGKSAKMSLRKHKNMQKMHQFASNCTLHQQTHQKLMQAASFTQQQFFIQRTISCETEQRLKSQISQNSSIRVTFNQPALKDPIIPQLPPATPKLQFTQPHHQLDDTAKICKQQELNDSQLFQTKKVIPGSRYSLEELSQMKRSVHSICQGEEKTKIEESTIIVDYFHPSNSRLADIKMKPKLQGLLAARQQSY